jgi:hypothetical protein
MSFNLIVTANTINMIIIDLLYIETLFNTSYLKGKSKIFFSERDYNFTGSYCFILSS